MNSLHHPAPFLGTYSSGLDPDHFVTKRILCQITHGGEERSNFDDMHTAIKITSKCMQLQGVAGQVRRRKLLHVRPGHATTDDKSVLHGMCEQQRQFGLEYPIPRLIDCEIHGVTSNSTIFQEAICFSGAYYVQFRKLMQEGHGVEDAYWKLVVEDVKEACNMFLPIYDESIGQDGYVSLEVAPYLAYNRVKTLEATNWLHLQVNKPNVYVRIPATTECLPAIEQAISLGISVNCTLIFSLEMYEAVIEAYLRGLEALEAQSDLSHISGVASFFVSRVDSHVTHKLEQIGTQKALSLRGRTAGALAALAFELYQKKFIGPRWEALAKRGAKKQHLLWASTSVQNPGYPDTLYVVPLLKADTVNTMPANPQEVYLKHVKTVRTDGSISKEARQIYDRIQELGISWSDVSQFLQREGIQSLQDSFESTLTALVKADLEELLRK